MAIRLYCTRAISLSRPGISRTTGPPAPGPSVARQRTEGGKTRDLGDVNRPVIGVPSDTMRGNTPSPGIWISSFLPTDSHQPASSQPPKWTRPKRSVRRSPKCFNPASRVWPFQGDGPNRRVESMTESPPLAPGFGDPQGRVDACRHCATRIQLRPNPRIANLDWEALAAVGTRPPHPRSCLGGCRDACLLEVWKRCAQPRGSSIATRDGRALRLVAPPALFGPSPHPPRRSLAACLSVNLGPYRTPFHCCRDDNDSARGRTPRGAIRRALCGLPD